MTLSSKYKDFLKTEEWGSLELYKWEAVSVFQKNWDIDATNVSDMLKRSLSVTKNLLVSQSNDPTQNVHLPYTHLQHFLYHNPLLILM